MLSTKKRHFVSKIVVRGHWTGEKFEVESKTDEKAVVFLHVTATDKNSAKKTVIDTICYNFDCMFQITTLEEVETCYEFEYYRRYKPNNVNAMEASEAFTIFDKAQPYFTGNEPIFELIYELDNI